MRVTSLFVAIAVSIEKLQNVLQAEANLQCTDFSLNNMLYDSVKMEFDKLVITLVYGQRVSLIRSSNY